MLPYKYFFVMIFLALLTSCQQFPVEESKAETSSLPPFISLSCPEVSINIPSAKDLCPEPVTLTEQVVRKCDLEPLEALSEEFSDYKVPMPTEEQKDDMGQYTRKEHVRALSFIKASDEKLHRITTELYQCQNK